jgi:6-pyruvoyltetrahydropterin/6-carboxytetrahydropterin synthase
MKATVVKRFYFDSAHRLPGYPGLCGQFHGHTWILEVGVQDEIKNGMVMDFNELKLIVKKNVIDKLDHTYLNDIIHYPTIENILLWILDKLKEKVENLKFIRCWETPTSYAEITADYDDIGTRKKQQELC